MEAEIKYKPSPSLKEDLLIKANAYCGSYKLPALTYGEYHTAANGAGMNLPSGSILATSQTIYFNYVATTPPFCVIDTPFNIVIIASQNVPTLANVFDCT